MKQLFITEVEQSLLSILDNAQMKALHEALTHALWGKNIVAVDSAVEQPEAQNNAQLLEMFLSAKRVEGCSEKTLYRVFEQPTAYFDKVLPLMRKLSVPIERVRETICYPY